MANFLEAFNKTMTTEGGYVNDQTDAGGETYKGISRVYNPQWPGWEEIDEWKSESDFPQCLNEDKELQKDVEGFYKMRYWDVNRLNEFPQSIAEEIFDTGVNMGVTRAAQFFQEACNYLNRNEKSYDDLVVDGNIGSKSLGALQYLIEHNDIEILLTIMNVLQGMYYINYMKKSPTQEKYARGWFRRVKL